MKTVALLIILAVALVCSRAETNAPLRNFWTQGKPGHPPVGLELNLIADKTNYFLGENILLHYRIRNISTNSFSISVGGDYRGSSRADRFSVTAVDAVGKAVADPTPLMQNMGGGWMSGGEIKPGAEWFEKVMVIEYCRFDAPGSYTVRAFHDLGFGEKTNADPREATVTITLTAPSEVEAEAILVAAENAKPPNLWEQRRGQRGEARLDYPCIRWPTFLKPLQKRAATGSDTALAGIKSIRTIEATRVLVDLLDHTNTAFVTSVAQTLEVRLPHPASDFAGHWGPQRRQFIIEEVWEDSLGAPVRAACVRLLAQKNRGDLLAAMALLRLIGTTNETRAMRDALGFAVTQKTPEYLADVHYPAPIRVCDAIAGTMLGLDAAYVEKLDPEKSPENLVLYICRNGGGDKTLSDSDIRYFSKALKHKLPYLRMKALECLPNKVPTALYDNITRCMTDSNLGVQNYAFVAAERMESPAHRDIALRVLKAASDHWVRASAERIAGKYNSRYDAALAWCAHLIVPKDINDYATHDALRHLLEMTTGRLSGGGFNPPLTTESAGDLRKHWERFLKENKDAIIAGKLFKVGPGGLPEKLLPPGWALNQQ